MHQILNKNKHGDYVIATGNSVKLKKLVSTFLKLNNLSMKKNTKINKTFFRDEPKKIFADISKLKRNLKYILLYMAKKSSLNSIEKVYFNDNIDYRCGWFYWFQTSVGIIKR